VTLHESMRLSVCWRGDNALPTLDECFLHLRGSVVTVEFVVESTRIADGVAGSVAAPEWSSGGVAILASYEEVT